MTSHDTSEARPGDLWSLPMLQDHCARRLVTTPLPSTLRGSHNPLATGPSLPCSQCSSHQGVSGRAAGPSPTGCRCGGCSPTLDCAEAPLRTAGPPGRASFHPRAATWAPKGENSIGSWKPLLQCTSDGHRPNCTLTSLGSSAVTCSVY